MVHRIHPRARGKTVRMRRVPRRLAAAAGVLAAVSLIAAPVALSAQAAVGLGTDDSFAVLAGSAVTNTGPSVISGSVGLDPGSAVTGFPPGLVLAGTTEIADGVSLQAKSDLVTAYNDAAGRSSTATITGDLAGRTLTSGVYTATTSLGLSGALTLDAQGDPNAVFIFQAGSTLIVGSSSQVNLIGGAQACNVYWQVGSSATIGTGSAFVGNILALTSISMTTGATLQGRALARNGAVTLDTNTITRPICTGAGSTSGSTTTPTGSGTPTSGATSTTGTTGATGTAPTRKGTAPARKKTKPKTRAHKPVTHRRPKAVTHRRPKAVKPAPAKHKPPAKPPAKPVTPTPVIPTAPKPPAFTG